MGLDISGIMTELINRADVALKAGAEELSKALRTNLTRKSGTPSSPGEYPAKQTGDLVRSIKIKRRRVGKNVSYQVSVDADYAEPLEKIRPFFQRTVDENESSIIEKMNRAGKR